MNEQTVPRQRTKLSLLLFIGAFAALPTIHHFQGWETRLPLLDGYFFAVGMALCFWVALFHAMAKLAETAFSWHGRLVYAGSMAFMVTALVLQVAGPDDSLLMRGATQFVLIFALLSLMPSLQPKREASLCLEEFKPKKEPYFQFPLWILVLLTIALPTIYALQDNFIPTLVFLVYGGIMLPGIRPERSFDLTRDWPVILGVVLIVIPMFFF